MEEPEMQIRTDEQRARYDDLVKHHVDSIVGWVRGEYDLDDDVTTARTDDGRIVVRILGEDAYVIETDSFHADATVSLVDAVPLD
jgi:hypothetical protein